MFNLYIYEKRLKDKNLQETEKINKKIKHDLHVKKRNHLAEKFYQKINDFLIDIIRKPIIINNNYYNEKEKKKNNSFCLYKFQTDKERIEKLLNSDAKYNNNKNNPKKLNRSQSNIIFNNNSINSFQNVFNNDDFIHINNHHHEHICGDIINQPSMKFKPRNDLERIIETINMNKSIYLKKNKYIKFRKENDEKEMIHNNNDVGMIISYGEKNHKKNNSSEKKDKFYNKEKNNILNKKINLSNVVKNMTERYHSKTYFNSIEQALLFNKEEDKKIFKKFKKYNKNNPKTFKMNKSSVEMNFLPKINNKDSQDLNEYSDRNNYFKKFNNKKKILFRKNEFIDNSINDISLDLSLDENDKNYVIDKILKLNNPISQDTKLNNEKLNDNYSNQNENLKILKNIAINKSINRFPFSPKRRKSQISLGKFFLDYEIASNMNNNKKEIIEDDNYILINNHIYNKKNKNDIKKLGQLALRKCQFINAKFNDEKNNQLKKGEGKLMMTNGLSLKQFMEKYSLPIFGNKK